MTKRTWTEIGKEYTAVHRCRYAAAIANLEWTDISEKRLEGMMPAQNISEAIKQLHLPKVSHYAISSELAPLGFYGIRCRYKDGMAQIYVVDAGSHLCPIAIDFTALRRTHDRRRIS